MNKLIVGYARVSVKENGESIINQIELIKAYCKTNSLNLDKCYIDNGESGINFKRTAFLNLINDIEAKKIAMVIVKDISRLGRELLDSSYYIVDYFKHHHVHFISIEENIDETLVYIKSIMNDSYVKDISLKRKSTAMLKTLNKEFIGPYAPLGYKICYIDSRRTLKIDEEKEKIIKKIFDLFIKGMSYLEISSYLNKFCNNEGITWKERKIRDIITNPIYKGSLVVRKSKKENYKSKSREYVSPRQYEIIPNVFPKIIDSSLFDYINGTIKKYKNHKIKDNKINYYNNVICSKCNKKMHLYRRYRNNEFQYYFKCLGCHKTIFYNRLKNILTESFCNFLYSFNVFEIFQLVINNYKKELLQELESNKKSLNVSLRNNYILKVKKNMMLDEFLSMKSKATTEYNMLQQEYDYIVNYNFNNISDFYESLNCFDFVDKIEINDWVIINYKFKRKRD